ncbi:MAG: carbohydrate-binding protein [Clostridia bacterium]|nr:carbohydrate-binding protein [Clostridia bacterium]
MYNNYVNNGVIITPNVVAEGDKATFLYKGLLFKSGADYVYMRAGYGDDWRSTTDIKMNPTGEGFEASLPVTERDKLNVVFKDSANNWDNNSGMNYSFKVESKY